MRQLIPMSEYEKLKDMLEMAELLTAEFESTLEVETYNETTDKTSKIIFEFGPDQELENVYVEY